MSVTKNAVTRWASTIAKLQAKLTHPHLLQVDRVRNNKDLKHAKAMFQKALSKAKPE